MSQAARDLCRRAYDLWNGEEYEAFFALMSPDVVWEERHNPEVGLYRGRDGVKEWVAVTSGAFQTPRFEPLRFIDDGEAVVIEVLFRGQGTSSGIEVAARLAHAVRVREGMVIYLASFPEVEQALEAVGLAG
jgi:ketosteroid isomerase-like protein